MSIEAVFAILIVFLFVVLPLLRPKEKVIQKPTVEHMPPPPKRHVAIKNTPTKRDDAPLPKPKEAPTPKAPLSETPVPHRRKALILSYEILSPPLALRDQDTY